MDWTDDQEELAALQTLRDVFALWVASLRALDLQDTVPAGGHAVDL